MRMCVYVRTNVHVHTRACHDDAFQMKVTMFPNAEIVKILDNTADETRLSSFVYLWKMDIYMLLKHAFLKIQFITIPLSINI